MTKTVSPITPPIVEPELLTPDQLSLRIGVSVEQLSNWRGVGLGPAYVKLGTTDKARVRYPIKLVRAWEESLPVHTPSLAQDVEAAL